MIFSKQSELWLDQLRGRKKNPVKPSSLVQFQSQLRYINRHLGERTLASLGNKDLRVLAESTATFLSPKTIQCYLTTVKAVIASAVDEDGNQLYPRTWNSDFIDAPTVTGQNTPTFTPEQVADIVKNGGGFALLFKLAAGTGIRIGEILALDKQHINNRTLKVEKSLSQDGEVQTPKTAAGFREVDITKELADELQNFAPLSGYQASLKALYTTLDALKIKKAGFHAFRRFRATHLGKEKVPNELIKFWLGHADGSVTARYDKIETDLSFRLAEAERVGLGF